MKYRPEIDGLRAVAVVPVILFHAGFSTFGGGYVGVDIFFVISGYLITSIILSELAEGRFTLKRFYERRARRILPALFFIMAVSIPFAWLWLLPREMVDYSQSLFATAGFGANFLFWQETGYFSADAEVKPLLHTWSLAVEEQYYIVFPVLLLLLRRWFPKAQSMIFGLLLVVSFGLAQWLSADYPEQAFFLPHTRAWELLLGVVLAYWLASPSQDRLPVSLMQAGSLLGLALIGISVLAYDKDTPFPGGYALAPALGAALVILFAREGTLVNKALASRGLVFVGLISYSAYLWHQPLFAFARLRDATEPPSTVMVALCLAVLPLAVLTWRYVETPFRTGRALSGFRLLVASASVAAFLALVGGLGYLMAGNVWRYEPDVMQLFAERDAKAGWPACSFVGPQRIARVEKCAARGPHVFLIGDSHAEALSPALRDELARHGVGLISWTRDACLPIAGTTRLPISARLSCLQYKQQVFDYLNRHPAPLVISARWRVYVEGARFDNEEGGRESGGDATNFVIADRKLDLREHISQELSKLAERMPVIVVNQIPEAGWDVPNRMARIMLAGGDANALSTSHAVYLAKNARVFEMFDRLRDRMTIVDPAIHVCNSQSGRCMNAENGRPLYKDDDHPAKAFARKIVLQISEAVLAGRKAN